MSAATIRQQVLDMAVNMQNGLANGTVTPGSKYSESQLWAAIQLITQAAIGATPSAINISGGSLYANDVPQTSPANTPQL